MPSRGGSWINASYAGVFCLLLYGSRSSSNYNRGFRSALLSSSGGAGLRACTQHRENKGVYHLPGKGKNMNRKECLVAESKGTPSAF